MTVFYCHCQCQAVYPLFVAVLYSLIYCHISFRIDRCSILYCSAKDSLNFCHGLCVVGYFGFIVCCIVFPKTYCIWVLIALNCICGHFKHECCYKQLCSSTLLNGCCISYYLCLHWTVLLHFYAEQLFAACHTSSYFLVSVVCFIMMVSCFCCTTVLYSAYFVLYLPVLVYVVLKWYNFCMCSTLHLSNVLTFILLNTHRTHNCHHI